MAILKHKSSKNASYSDVQDYLTYKHTEDQKTGHYVPILDEFGLLQERENCVLTYINGYGEEGDPDDWSFACIETNLRWGKNNTKQDVKQHQYIIAHPASDCALVTKEDLLEEGKEFARANLQGFDTLIAVHMDQNHYHIHCVCNSVRSVKREEQPWMLHNEDGNVVRCEVAAGGKHRDSSDFRRHCQEWLLDYTRSHGWTVKDNLSIENQRKAERQKDTKQELVNLLVGTASQCSSMPQLQMELKRQYQIDLVVRGQTYTLYLPNRKKGIRLNKLDLTPEDLIRSMGLDQNCIDRINQAAGAKKEQKKYSQWIRQQRIKNAMQAEDLISTAKQILSDADAEEIDTVKFLIKKVAYAERDLNTELGKMKYIQDRWMEYLDSSDSEKHNRCCGYIRWAGYNPDSRSELEELRTMIQMAELQIENLQLKRIALTERIPSCLSDLAEAERSNHIAPTLFPYEQEIENDVSVQPDYMDSPSDSIQRADSPAECGASPSGNIPSNTWWTESYKQARKYLYGSKNEKPQHELAYQFMLREAAKDNGLALHDLAKMHQTGLGCNQDHILAEKLFSNAYCAFLGKLPSEKNPAYLQYRIGKLFLQGLGVEKSYAAAAEWFEKSSAAGNPYAAYSLASLYHHGQGVELNEEKAFSLYKIAASNTHAPNAYAAYELGNMCKTGKGTEKDIEASEQWYRKAYAGFLKLEQSTLDDTLLYRLGQMNAKGMGTDMDTTKAISYYKKAAKLKNTNALYGLGMLYINPSLPEYNPQKAIPYLGKAAESENPFAQYQLGKLYLTGEHVYQDVQAAVNLFTAAAENGNDMAMYQLGKLFYYGEQVPQNFQKAITYLETASSHNNLSAMTLLGTIYLNEESSRDQRKGVNLLQKAAARNNPAAQYQLGKHFYYASRNYNQALSYLHRAAEQEHTGAMALLGKILITEGSRQDVMDGIDLLLKVKSQDNTECKELLAEIRHNRKEFAEIASRYQAIADQLKYNSMQQSEAVRFRQMWHNQLEAERYLKKKIKEQRRDSRYTKSKQRDDRSSR